MTEAEAADEPVFTTGVNPAEEVNKSANNPAIGFCSRFSTWMTVFLLNVKWLFPATCCSGSGMIFISAGPEVVHPVTNQPINKKKKEFAFCHLIYF